MVGMRWGRGGSSTTRWWRFTRGLAFATAFVAGPALAFDHADGPAVLVDPSTDITDLFAWMSPDATRLNLIMTVTPQAGAQAEFSDSASYVFHTASRAAYLSGPSVPVDVICRFGLGSPQSTQCWVGTQAYVTGDASAPAGLVSADGHVRVFAGLRDDPAFANLDGLKNFESAFISAFPSLSFDAAGCPALNASTSAALVGLLQHDAGGSGPGTDFFLGQNVLAIVVSVDLPLVTGGGPIVSVWGSTNR